MSWCRDILAMYVLEGAQMSCQTYGVIITCIALVHILRVPTSTESSTTLYYALYYDHHRTTTRTLSTFCHCTIILSILSEREV